MNLKIFCRITSDTVASSICSNVMALGTALEMMKLMYSSETFFRSVIIASLVNHWMTRHVVSRIVFSSFVDDSEIIWLQPNAPSFHSGGELASRIAIYLFKRFVVGHQVKRTAIQVAM